jgi:hypothetical protein
MRWAAALVEIPRQSPCQTEVAVIDVALSSLAA